MRKLHTVYNIILKIKKYLSTFKNNHLLHSNCVIATNSSSDKTGPGPVSGLLYANYDYYDKALEQSVLFIKSTLFSLQKRVCLTFPTPIDKWAIDKAQRALKRGRKKLPVILPADKIHSLLKEVLHNNRLDDQVSLYIVAVLEYIAADILKVRLPD